MERRPPTHYENPRRPTGLPGPSCAMRLAQGCFQLFSDVSDVSAPVLRARYRHHAAPRWAAAKSQADHDGPITRTTERLGPDHEDLGAGRGRVPGLADGAAPVAGRPRGGGGRQLRP